MMAIDSQSTFKGCIKGASRTPVSIQELTPYKNILGGKQFIAT